MNIHRHIQLFLSLAAGLLALAFTMTLVIAQGPGQDDVIPDLPELRTEVLEYRWAHRASSPGRDLRAQGIEATADVRPPGSFDVVLLSEDFEWSDYRWSYDGLWHDVLGYLDIVASPYSRNHSPVYSMWYGQDGTGDYSTGATTFGMMTTTQVISIPTSAVSVTVSFWSWEETEQSGGPRCAPPPALCPYDFRGLFISGTVTTTWQMLWSTWFTPTVEQQWHQVVADISAYRGQAVNLVFYFHSLDNF